MVKCKVIKCQLHGRAYGALFREPQAPLDSLSQEQAPLDSLSQEQAPLDSYLGLPLSNCGKYRVQRVCSN